MKNKFKYLVSLSLKRKVATKWFVIANIVIGMFIIGIANIDSIIKYFGGDFAEKQVIYVIDNTNRTFDVFKSNIDNLSISGLDTQTYLNYDVKKYDKSIDEVKAEITKNGKIWAVIFDNDTNIIKAKVISEGYIDTLNYQVLSSVINSTKSSIAIKETSIPTLELQKLTSPVVISREYIDLTKKSQDEQMETVMSTVFPVVILPFFMLTIFLIQMIGAEVNDEKTTRGMEIIISNVSPKTHFFAKVLAGNLFVLIQAGILLLFGSIGLFIRGMVGGDGISNGAGAFISQTIDSIMQTGIGDKLVYIIPLTLILMIITFVGYALFAGILASMTTNIEDFQQLQTPVMLVSVLSYYLSIMAGLFKGSIFIKVLSYIPFISAILSPSLLVLGYTGIVDVIISIILMLIMIYLLVHYGLRVYKIGILNYSSSGLWKKMFKALKNN